MKILLIILFVMLFPAISFGANCGASAAIYYVDYTPTTGGDNRCNGLYPASYTGHEVDLNCAWKTAPGGTGSASRPVPNCTLQPGDIVVFKGGVEYEDSINSSGFISVIDVLVSGSSGSPIVYDGDSGTCTGCPARWASGTDKAIIDGQSLANVAFSFTGARTYVTINNFVIKDTKHGWNTGEGNAGEDCASQQFIDYSCGPTPPVACPGTGAGILIRADSGVAHHIVLTNNDMSHGGVWDAGHASGGCVYSTWAHDWTISNNTFTDCGSVGLMFVEPYNIQFDHNTIEGHNTWALAAGMSSVDCVDNTNFSIFNNTFKDINKGRNVFYCGFEHHGNWIYFFTYSPCEKGFQDIKIYNNDFYNDYEPLLPLLTAPSSSGIQFVPENPAGTNGPLYIFNNNFYNGDSSAISVSVYLGSYVAALLTDLYVFNNNFVMLSTENPIRTGPGYYGASSVANFYIKNNLSMTSGNTSIQVPFYNSLNIGGHEQIDYNFYYNPSNTDVLEAYGTRSDPGNVYGEIREWMPLSTWVTRRRSEEDGYFDINSPNHTLYGDAINLDPGLTNTACIGNPCATPFNLRPTATSRLIDKGVNLTSLCDSIFSTDSVTRDACKRDKDGTLRPALAAWEIGAYEYGGTPASYDWRDINGVNYVSSVKDQGACGSCWAFATTAGLESRLIIDGVLTRAEADLSEQVMISCCNNYIADCGNCTSGNVVKAMSYIYNYGLPVESCYVYIAANGDCSSNDCCSTKMTSTYKITDYGSETNPDAATVKSRIYTYGPVVCDFQRYSDYYAYTGGIYSYVDGTDPVGHDLLLVGYNDTGSYFIAKDTRGAAWGESGFSRIAYTELESASGTSRLCTALRYFIGPAYDQSAIRPGGSTGIMAPIMAPHR